MALIISRRGCSILGISAVLMGSLSAQTATSTTGSGTGGISGTVVGDDGTAVVGAVIANGVGLSASGRVVAAADGSFTISNLPPGTFSLCARPKGGGYLDPCTWSDPLQVVVTAGKVTTGTQVIVAKGAVVSVRVNDPGLILSLVGTQPNVVTPHLLLHAMTPRGLLEPLVITETDALGREYQATIPFSVLVTIVVSGKQVLITDSAGNSLNAAGTAITIQQAPNNPPTTITLQVSTP